MKQKHSSYLINVPPGNNMGGCVKTGVSLVPEITNKYQSKIIHSESKITMLRLSEKIFEYLWTNFSKLLGCFWSSNPSLFV